RRATGRGRLLDLRPGHRDRRRGSRASRPARGRHRPMTPRRARTPLDVDAYVEGVLSGSRTVLARAITLVESTNPEHERLAQQVLTRVLPHTGKAQRIGISGVPGAGKSTFIDAFGSYLTGLGHKVAVLAIDPSSRVSGGSILGDKTRMPRLANDPT